ncbi:non-lysosomal glucosylceramidase [Plakobranchus ocellatus]|uniref:Non-lysosomal glucosylceramidase n=1 Tax=Plakobranchus ocellatus TaxID=259542 RepID=A0AAV3Y5T6_9GAST|nr:non-lysosomal glucosylceramidase [Plakobranchus ocellatus]
MGRQTVYGFLTFLQRFPQGLQGSATQPNRTISAFPSFRVQTPTTPATGDIGYLSYGSFMFGDRAKTAGILDSNATFNDGLDGSGPIAFFDKKGNALIISPFNNFMAASMWQEDDAAILDWGIMGGVDSLPKGFEHKTIAFCSNHSIGHAFEGWGEILKTVYNKTQNVTDFHQTQDLSLTHLGYWTDNGAYYYYNPLPGKDYEVTLLNVQKYANDENIPYRYVQLDSWFYPKDTVDAVKTWDATEDVFPKGINELQDRLHLPLVAHNRYWSVDTTYAKQNGGHFDFFIGNNLSLPVSQIFWQYLLGHAKEEWGLIVYEQIFWQYLLGHAKEEWGLIVYEQDWLNVQLLFTELLNTNLTAGRDWLLQMGAAALNHHLKIQYCMALSRHALQSLEIPVVTQARVSNDYLLQPDQWRVGVTSHFAHAMGVAPSKDTFWTNSDQPGNKYSKSEPYPLLQSAVATLSRGPVGPGDMIGGTNRTTLMRCCNEDGLILKPLKPARAIDDQIIKMAYGDNDGVDGEVWTTYSSHEGLLYGIIFAANLSADYSITAHKAGFLSPFAPKFKAGHLYSAQDGAASITDFDEHATFTIKASSCETDGEPFCLFYFSPQISFGSHKIVLLGDLEKWVPMSQQRVVQIWRTQSGMAASLLGQHGETIHFSFLLDGQKVTPSLTADQHGCATFPIVSSQDDYFDDLNESDANITTPSTTTTTTTTASTTTLRPSVPQNYDCRFKPPPFTTQTPFTNPPGMSTTKGPDNGAVIRAQTVVTEAWLFGSLVALISCFWRRL